MFKDEGAVWGIFQHVVSNIAQGIPFAIEVARELRREGLKFIYHTAGENLSYFGT